MSQWDITGKYIMKKLTKVIAVFLAVCFLMTSCYTTRQAQMSNSEFYEVLSQYTDLTKTGIIKYLGPPTREVSDGGDGTILVYESNNGSTTVATARQNNIYYNTQTHEKHTWVYLDSKGHCTHVNTNAYCKIEKEYNSGMTTGVIVSSVLLGLLGFCFLMIGITQ